MQTLNVLSKEELIEMNGALGPWAIAGIIAVVVLVIGAVDGYVNPNACKR